jgi:hypothetical protein
VTIYQQQPAYQPVTQPAPASDLAVAALVLGICGFLTCGLTSILAVILGHVAEIQTRDVRVRGRELALTGLIVGYVVLVPVIVVLLLTVMGGPTPTPTGLCPTGI